MIKSSRLVAFETLYKIFYDSAYSNLALDSALKGVNEDKAFISALVYGVVERRLTLDFFIKKYLKSKPKPKILTILRMGAYQLLFMDKVPSNAAINESVELTKAIKQDYYSSLVNAVLHKIDNDRIIPDDDLSVKYSVPQNLINMWLKQYDKEAVESFLPNINERPPIFAVPNLLYVDADELLYELMSEGIEGEVVDELVMITSSFDLSNSKAFANGLFHIEDMSSYECAKALGAKPYEIVLDMCSAPGGKSFTIAEHMQNKGTLLAFDLHEHRVKQIEDGSDRLGISIIKATVNDASVYNPNLPKADRILCDVPCSGFGIIRRKPEIRYKELDSISDLPAIQLGILETSAKYLKDGGALIYSTCTLNKKENEKVVNAFLNNNSDFTLAGERTTFPSKLGGDGFYHAVLIKNEN
ncbi:MAG: 16S rRNA (cytosine(967)-C(5))-methyltransferase RsmB [Eubacterium sp.]|nr:16S rRNA (cytosine(967)-C(5))-methyltransferase RsmB [Eubacterium sp.]